MLTDQSSKDPESGAQLQAGKACPVKRPLALKRLRSVTRLLSFVTFHCSDIYCRSSLAARFERRCTAIEVCPYGRQVGLFLLLYGYDCHPLSSRARKIPSPSPKDSSVKNSILSIVMQHGKGATHSNWSFYLTFAESAHFKGQFYETCPNNSSGICLESNRYYNCRPPTGTTSNS